MKHIPRLLLLAALLLLPACIPSINPLYTEKDLAYDTALVGTWGEPGDGKETWAFEQDGPKKYKLLVTDNKGRVAQFEARLVQLDKYRFLDLFVVDLGGNLEGQVNDMGLMGTILRPGHMFARIHQIEPGLQMTFLDPDWIERFLREHPKALGHEMAWNGNPTQNGRRLVLTASTRDLQKFVIKHADEAFPPHENDALVRRKTSKASK